MTNYRYAIPVEATSPWPEMRHDERNTGASPIVASYHGDVPWSFQTDKGIFLSAVIGGDGTVYFGSADTHFYAVSPSGKLVWRFKTGNVIDSAAVLGRSSAGATTVTFGSGDGNLYQLRTGTTGKSADRVLWHYQAPASHSAGQQVSWWEGNVELATDGTLLAGNTGGDAFALHPNGTLRFEYRAGNSVWTAAAVSPDGTSYWGSLSASIFALDANGTPKWSAPTGGFVVASPALGSDGTLYGASFDGKVYAIDQQTGAVKWNFQTADAVYSSPALLSDASGRTTAVIVASTDGSVYSLTPSGHLNWRYDTGDVVRSSPVIGLAPTGDPAGHIVYVGSGNGRLYALDAATGQRRWSFDTTAAQQSLRDRNDLNSSPALGTTGIYIGSEDGSMWYMPYDYCLHQSDRRCATGPGGTFAPTVTAAYLVTPGGSTVTSTTATVSPVSVLPFRLVVRRNGVPIDAAFDAANPPTVTVTPPVTLTTSLSGDGKYLFAVPDHFLQPNTRYHVTIAGSYEIAAPPLGDGSSGTVQTQLTLVTPPGASNRLPLAVGARQVSALHITRLAFPLPSFLPSVNQIGFDSYDWIASTLQVSPPNAKGDGTVLLFVVGASRGPDGLLAADPATPFAFPLEGSYHGDLMSVSAANVTLPFSFGPVPLRQLTFRMQLGPDLVAQPDTSVFAVVHCNDVPFYGPLLEKATTLCNQSGDLPVSGTFLASGYDAAGGATTAPPGLSVTSVELQHPSTSAAGAVTASFALSAGMHYRAGAHVVSLVLSDAGTGAVVPLDYRSSTTSSAGPNGDLELTTLQIPAGTVLPARLRVNVVTDAFPIAARNF
ncbi:MAG TPA: PQQ-binding-like beta-propeller repeat protein [Acidimicrobiales bacterium]|nr:PQQ-binding-like beta-propeller repeat protein [Acidimicrobiales bacterium]